MEQPAFRPGDPNLPKPLYPMQAKLRRQQGTVLLSIVLAAGRVASVSVAQSSGYGILDSSARKWAAEKWTFPPQYSGNFEVPVAFQLDSQ
jgi:protein TonB